MRDAHRIRERLGDGFTDNRVTWLTLGALLLLGAAFGAGYNAGRRAERLQTAQASTTLPAPPSDRALDHNLKFYSALAGESARDVPPEPETKPSPAIAKTPSTPRHYAPPPATLAPGQKVPESDRPPFIDAADRESALASALLRRPGQPGQYTVQVSSFPTEAEARAFSSALERKGFKPYVVSADLVGKGTWYRVRIGRFENEDQARQAKGVLARSDIPAWVLRSE